MLKACYRQYQQYSKVQTMLKNNLISLLDTTFPDANRLFTSPPRDDGREKWIDFVATFWHRECVCDLSEKAFAAKYQKWCKKYGYNFSEGKALGHLCRRPWALRCHAQNGYGKTFGGTGYFPTPGNFLRISCSQTGDAVPGGFSAGVSCGDGDVWCWPYSRPSTHG